MENLKTSVERYPAASDADSESAAAGPVAATEKMAVYIGRASFRMTNVGDANPPDGAMPTDRSKGFGLTEEHVVLSPPANLDVFNRDAIVEILVATDDAVVGRDGDAALVATTAPVAESTAIAAPTPKNDFSIESGHRGRNVISGPRRSVLWPVAIALAAGAFVTLTAQAVIRRSPRTAAMTERIARLTDLAPPKTAVPTPTLVPENHPETHPLVALSTAEVSDAKAGSDSESRPAIHAAAASATERARRSRNPLLAKRSTPASGSIDGKNQPSRAVLAFTDAGHGRTAKTARGTASWIDPFATTTPTPRVITKSTAATGPEKNVKLVAKKAPKSAAQDSQRPARNTGWVDPFAN